MPAKRAESSRIAGCGTQWVSSRPSHAIDSMPCAMTSGMPARRAKSMSMWIGLWSPEAPAKSASVVRSSGGSASSGSRSPTAALQGSGSRMARGVMSGGSRGWCAALAEAPLQVAPGGLRTTMTERIVATSAPCWLVAVDSLTMNSSAPLRLA